MKVISSIIYNRLNASNAALRKLQCDSTVNYIEAHEAELSILGTYNMLSESYDTYKIEGLPIGPICNPGADAIKAAMQPAETGFYYFLHDSEGRIYLAETLEQHEANARNHLSGN